MVAIPSRRCNRLESQTLPYSMATYFFGKEVSKGEGGRVNRDTVVAICVPHWVLFFQHKSISFVLLMKAGKVRGK